jgi:hypothetical protein
MPVSRESQKSMQAIRLRAEALALSGQQTDCTGEAETLAGFADGVISFSDVDNAALDDCIETGGVERFIDAVTPAVPQTSAGQPWYRQKPWLVAAASLAIVAGSALYYTSSKLSEVKPVHRTADKTVPVVAESPRTSKYRTPSMEAQHRAPVIHPAPEAKVASVTTTRSPELNASSTIRDALAAKYLRNPAQIVVLQKGQMWMSGPVQNTYENGRISPDVMAPTAFGKVATVPRVRPGRFAVPGERMRVKNIYADDDGIIFDVATDDTPGAQYQAFIGFPFDEGTKPSADQVARDVADVFTIERPRTTSVELGRTIDEETSILGEPRRIFVVGAKSIFLYDRTKVTFIEGIASGVEKVTMRSTAAARVLRPKKVSP